MKNIRTNSSFKGRCEAHDLNCNSPLDVLLPIFIDDGIKAYSFCCVKCANDFYGELSLGTEYPFPLHESAPTEEQVQDNIDWLRKSYADYR